MPLLTPFVLCLPTTVHAETAVGWSYPNPGLPEIHDEELPEDLLKSFNLSDWTEPFESAEKPAALRTSPRPRRKAPTRELFLEFASPLDRFETNTRAWYSANQMLAYTNDLLGVQAGLDGHLAGRVFLLASGRSTTPCPSSAVRAGTEPLPLSPT